MSFIAIPPSVAWLLTADDNTVKHEHYIQCLVDHANWLLACGVDPFRVQDPLNFCGVGDLQILANVVSKWPLDAPATHQAPTLHRLLQQLHVMEGQRPLNFLQSLNWYVERIHAWLIGKRRDPGNPNETKDERDARLNRERVARYRLRNASAESDDPELNALIMLAKEAEANATAGRKWIKDEIKQAKLDMDTAILDARTARVARVKRAEEWLALAEKQVFEAQELVRQHKAHK